MASGYPANVPQAAQEEHGVRGSPPGPRKSLRCCPILTPPCIPPRAAPIPLLRAGTRNGGSRLLIAGLLLLKGTRQLESQMNEPQSERRLGGLSRLAVCGLGSQGSPGRERRWEGCTHQGAWQPGHLGGCWQDHNQRFHQWEWWAAASGVCRAWLDMPGNGLQHLLFRELRTQGGGSGGQWVTPERRQVSGQTPGG